MPNSSSVPSIIDVIRSVMKPPPAFVELVNHWPIVRDDAELDANCRWLSFVIGFNDLKAEVLEDIVRGRRDERQFAGLLGASSGDKISIDEINIEGRDGQSIAARLYRPKALAKRAPLLVFFHGGGWVYGSLETHGGTAEKLAVSAEAVVLSVDYRLAPEHAWPAGMNDCVDAFRWAATNADELDIDPERIAVGGDSAGGNLAAVATHELRDDDCVPCFQLLVYPVCDISKDSESYEKFSEGFLLSRADMHWFRDRYTRSPEHWADPRVSPLLAEDFSGLPRAHVVTAGFDPLRDEGQAYAEQLRQAGVEVSEQRCAHYVHGFLSLSQMIPGSDQAINEICDALKAGLNNQPWDAADSRKKTS